MSASWKVKNSRAQWKAKAIDRGNSERDHRKTIKRQSKKISALKKEIKCLRSENEDLKNIVNKPLSLDKTTVVLIALRLFSHARIGFRAVSRVLATLAEYLNIQKPPCPQTVINWTCKLSLVKISSVIDIPALRSGFSNGWIFLIDESIGHSGCKILAVLGVRLEHYKINNGYPTFSDVQCAGVAVAPSWTGENIANFLRKLVAITGRPSAFLKDGGSNLEKACQILDDEGLGSPLISDISHVAANLLKSEYGEHPDLDGFLSTCGRVSTNLKQTVLACLMPPKVRHKARFMNLHRLMDWAERVLDLSPPGRAKNGSILQKLRNGIDHLPSYRSFVKNFLRDARSLLSCQAILKTHGLTSKSKDACREILHKLPEHSSIKSGMIDWLNSQMFVAKNLGVHDDGLIVSSDSIESLFGLAKSHGTGELKDPHRMALRIPALCGGVTEEDVKNVISMPESRLTEIRKDVPSLLAERKKIFQGKSDLESLDPKPATFELLPSPKNRSKNQNKAMITDGSKKSAETERDHTMTMSGPKNLADTG